MNNKNNAYNPKADIHSAKTKIDLALIRYEISLIKGKRWILPKKEIYEKNLLNQW